MAVAVGSLTLGHHYKRDRIGIACSGCVANPTTVH
jgi:hypothetical protein